MDLWQQVLLETKNKSKMHLGLSENVSNNVVNRFMIISDDCQRVAKKVAIYLLNVNNVLIFQWLIRCNDMCHSLVCTYI